MSETLINVSDAAKDFLEVLKRVESTGEVTVLMREGLPVAQISPIIADPASDHQQAVLAWQKLKRLDTEEAKSFADDLEQIASQQPPLKSAWD